MRIAVFLAAVGSVLCGVALLNWWLDPFEERYDPAPLAAALGQPKPCFVAWDAIGERAWPDLKLDLFRRRRALTVVVGTSRSAKIESHPGERRFANLLVPGTGPDTLGPLFRRLHADATGRLTVYVGVEAFWFGRAWRSRTSFTHSTLRDLKYLLSTETLHASLDELRHAPGAIRHPRAVHPWAIYRGHGVCVVDRGNSVLAGATNAWKPDGSLWFQYEIVGGPKPRGGLIVDIYRPSYTGKRLSERRVRDLERALAAARRYRWRLVGFAPPLAASSLRRLRNDPTTSGQLADFERRMPGIFARYGFAFLDLTDPASVPCGDDEFSFDDGGHPDAACGGRIRRLLDAAARELTRG